MKTLRSGVSAFGVMTVLISYSAMAQTPAVDWKAQQPELLRHYRDLIQIDTSSPPGNENPGCGVSEKGARS